MMNTRSLLTITFFLIASITEFAAVLLKFNNTTIPAIMNKYPIYFMYPNFTQNIMTSILGFLILAYVIYQFLPQNRDNPLIRSLDYPFWIICVCDIIWTVAFYKELFFISAITSAIWSLSLLWIITKLQAVSKESDFGRTIFIDFPFGLYAGFSLLFATMNISFYFMKTSTSWLGTSQIAFSLIAILFICFICAVQMHRRANLGLGLSLIWGFAGIAMFQYINLPMISSFAGSAMIFVGIITFMAYQKSAH